MPRDFLAARTAGFYIGGLLPAVDRIIKKTGSFDIGSQRSRHLACAAAYELEARGLLRPQKSNIHRSVDCRNVSGSAPYIAEDEMSWDAAVRRAKEDNAAFTFRGIYERQGDVETLRSQNYLLQELNHLVRSAGFERVVAETSALRSREDQITKRTRLLHHGHFWVPVMTLLTYIEAVESGESNNIIAWLTSDRGLISSAPPVSAKEAISLLQADGLVIEKNGRYQIESQQWRDALKKLARWSGLLASYDTLADDVRISEAIEKPDHMSFVDSRTLNVNSAGAGLDGFYKTFVGSRLETIQPLSMVVDVGTGSGLLLKLIHSDSRFSRLDKFASDLEETALRVARSELDGIITKEHYFIPRIDVSQPQELHQKVVAALRQDGLSEKTIQEKLAGTVVTNAFITHEARGLSIDQLNEAFKRYAERFPNMLVLEIPLLDPKVHAIQEFPQQGAEIAVFHLASGQTIQTRENWENRVFKNSGYRIVNTTPLNRLINPNTNKAEDAWATFVGYHLQR